MSPTNVAIEQLIPHRDRMKLVDDIVDIRDDAAVTRATVSPRWPLIHKGRTSPVVLVELVAQTAAVCIGWKETRGGDSAADGRGVLVGIKSADFFTDHLTVGQVIRTEAVIGFTMEHYTEIRGTTTIDGAPAAEIILQVLRQPDKETPE